MNGLVDTANFRDGLGQPRWSFIDLQGNRTLGGSLCTCCTDPAAGGKGVSLALHSGMTDNGNTQASKTSQQEKVKTERLAGRLTAVRFCGRKILRFAGAKICGPQICGIFSCSAKYLFTYTDSVIISQHNN